MVLPDDVIHGTKRHHFEVHDISDVSGGKWKAIHIPDEDISSMLKIANERKGSKDSLDIEHDSSVENPPSEVHGRVHAFDYSSLNSSKNSSRPVGNMENKERGKVAASQFYGFIKNVKTTKPKEADAKSRHEIHSKTLPSHPSVIVANVPDDDGDDSDDNLPIEKLKDPVVASLRKTPSKIKSGVSRSLIVAQLNTHSSTPSKLKEVPSLSTDGTAEYAGKVHNDPGTQSPHNVSINANDLGPESTDPKALEMLDKIKSLLLKSNSRQEDPPIDVKIAKKYEEETDGSIERKLDGNSGEKFDGQLKGKSGEKSGEKSPAISVHGKDRLSHRNNNGLFSSPPSNSPTDAFSNHAAALNRISSSKKEALLVGIIKALVARGNGRTSGNRVSSNSLPHYNKQAVLQGIQSLQMRKTFANAQNNDANPAVDTGNPASIKNLDELYQKQRDQQVKQELARANEESIEEKKMNEEETTVLQNYNRFMNPESRTNWKNMSPEESRTPGGQEISLMGTQQLNMIQDNPSPT